MIQHQNNTKKDVNLLDACWLPVRMQSGEVKELGLLALFEQAEKIVALADTSPLALIAQYRLLLAITHRTLNDHFPNWGLRDQQGWFNNGLPIEKILLYLEHWRERFWLFHPEHPFMQVAALSTATETADKLKPWTQIDMASVSGNAPVVFNHAVDSTPQAISCALAIRLLLGFLQFTPAGLVKVFRDSDKAGPLANTAAALPLGEKLTETLILALHPAALMHEDLPSWERPPLTIVDLKAPPVLASGPNDRYTRQTRAVLFERETDGSIRWLRFTVGQALEEDPHAPDPMASFREGSVGPVRLTFSEGRALWRDLPALLPDAGNATQAMPAAVLNGASSLNKRLGRAKLRLLVAGLANDQAKLLRWRVEQLELPQSLFEQPRATKCARRMMEITEKLFASLKGAAVQLIADTLPDSHQKESRSRARSLFDTGPVAPLFFAHAEKALMRVLAQSERDPHKADREWQRVLKEAALLSWEALLTSQGGSARLWRANAKTEPRLWWAIKDQLTALNEIGETQ